MDIEKAKHEMKNWIQYEKANKEKIVKADELIEIQETILSELDLKDKIINTMAEQLQGLAIFDMEKDEPIILGKPEEVIKHFEEKVEG